MPDHADAADGDERGGRDGGGRAARRGRRAPRHHLAERRARACGDGLHGHDCGLGERGLHWPVAAREHPGADLRQPERGRAGAGHDDGHGNARPGSGRGLRDRQPDGCWPAERRAAPVCADGIGCDAAGPQRHAAHLRRCGVRGRRDDRADADLAVRADDGGGRWSGDLDGHDRGRRGPARHAAADRLGRARGDHCRGCGHERAGRAQRRHLVEQRVLVHGGPHCASRVRGPRG